MTGTFTDSSIGHQRSADIAPDTDRESNLQRLIRKRAQNLKNDRENLKDRLERYIHQQAIQKWTLPTHPSYNMFDARLKSYDAWTRKEGVPSPDSLAEAGFFIKVHRCTNKFSYNSFVNISLISNTSSLQETLMILSAFTAASDNVNGFLVTFLMRNMQNGHPFVSMLHTSRAKLTLMKAGE